MVNVLYTTSVDCTLYVPAVLLLRGNQSCMSLRHIASFVLWRACLLPGDTTAGQNATEGMRHKGYSEVVMEEVRRRERVFVGDSIIRKADKAEYDVVVCFPGEK